VSASALTARRLASLVRLEQTVFALPHAYAGAILGAGGSPGVRLLAWITVAMVGARSFAMAMNRLIDHAIDGRNPRTARRELPAGLLSRMQVWAVAAASLLIFGAAVSQLAPITRMLWPLVVVPMVLYPYAKRFTPLSHLALGVTIGLAPVGAWVAVTDSVDWQAFLLGGAVALWVAGFDVIYATADIEVDRAEGLHSLPADFGLARALLATRVMHAGTVALLAGLGAALSLGPAYAVGVAVVAALLAYENAIVRPHDLSRVNAAFFTLNGLISLAFLAGVIADTAL
jgi:4-hydroxybenzoate polyprenyltransferase